MLKSELLDVGARLPATPERRLWVVESNGTPRSGKGTVNQALGKLFEPFSATDETGADYRAIAYELLRSGQIDPEMDDPALHRALEDIGFDQLADYAARRWEIVKEVGSVALYTPELNRVVPSVSPNHTVRQAVKEGFRRRVEGAVADDTVGILFVDGRNLGPIIQKVPGAQLLLRFFIKCSDSVAASREATRVIADLEKTGQGVSEDLRESIYQQALTSITRRRVLDEERTEDPAIADGNAMQYWHNPHVIQSTAEYYSKIYGISVTAARTFLNDSYYKGLRIGAGIKAFKESRQVVFDTNDTDKDQMIACTERMVREALSTTLAS